MSRTSDGLSCISVGVRELHQTSELVGRRGAFDKLGVQFDHASTAHIRAYVLFTENQLKRFDMPLAVK